MFKAAIARRCSVCKQPINIGDDVTWNRRTPLV